ncbi:MAG TPA: DUF4468 domain-containing protein [Puia sp.]|jgi:hypothetical protein
MKNLLFVLFFTPLFPLCQDSLPIKDGLVTYEEIDSVPAVAKDELFARSKIWFAKTFVSSKHVLESEDKEAGQFIGNANFSYPITVVISVAEWTCHYTIQIDCRDRKARIRLSNLRCSSQLSEMAAEKFNQGGMNSRKHIRAIDSHCRLLLANFKEGLTKPSADNF